MSTVAEGLVVLSLEDGFHSLRGNWWGKQVESDHMIDSCEACSFTNSVFTAPRIEHQFWNSSGILTWHIHTLSKHNKAQLKAVMKHTKRGFGPPKILESHSVYQIETILIDHCAHTVISLLRTVLTNRALKKVFAKFWHSWLTKRTWKKLYNTCGALIVWIRYNQVTGMYKTYRRR